MSINGVRNNFNWIYSSSAIDTTNVSADGTTRKIVGNKKLNQSNDINGIQLLTEEDLENVERIDASKIAQATSSVNAETTTGYTGNLTKTLQVKINEDGTTNTNLDQFAAFRNGFIEFDMVNEVAQGTNPFTDSSSACFNRINQATRDKFEAEIARLISDYGDLETAFSTMSDSEIVLLCHFGGNIYVDASGTIYRQTTDEEVLAGRLDWIAVEKDSNEYLVRANTLEKLGVDIKPTGEIPYEEDLTYQELLDSAKTLSNKMQENDVGISLNASALEMPYINKALGTKISSEYANFSNGIINDLKILFNADTYASQQANYASAFETFVENSMVKDYTKSNLTTTQIANETSAGDVVQAKDGLYVNDEGTLVKLNMTKEQYFELFPILDRYTMEQEDLGDCYFIAPVLISAMETPAGFAKLLQMFNYDSDGNITITFIGTPNYPVTFKNGKLFNIDKKADDENINILSNLNSDKTGIEEYDSQTSGCLGIQMLEQAYSMAKFARDANADPINSLDIDAALTYIDNGFSNEAMNFVFGKILTDVDIYNVEDTSTLVNEEGYYLFLNNSEITRFKNDLEDLASKINNKEVITSIGTNMNIEVSDDDYKNYYLIKSHSYSIESIDLENETITIINPWQTSISITLPMEKFYEYFLQVFVGDLTKITQVV